MGPRDHPWQLPDGATCSACGATVSADRMRILAERDDLAFVQLDCADCGSAALGLLTDVDDAHRPRLDVADDVATFRPDGRRVDPISQADVEAVRHGLAAWRGDLVGWLAAIVEPVDDRASRP